MQLRRARAAAVETCCGSTVCVCVCVIPLVTQRRCQKPSGAGLVYVVTKESYPEESASNFIGPDVAIL